MPGNENQFMQRKLRRLYEVGEKGQATQPLLLPPYGIFHSQKMKFPPSHSRAEGREEMAINHSHWSTLPQMSAFLKSCILASFPTIIQFCSKARGAQQKDPHLPKPWAGSSAQPELSSKETPWHSPPSAPTAKGCFNQHNVMQQRKSIFPPGLAYASLNNNHRTHKEPDSLSIH